MRIAADAGLLIDHRHQNGLALVAEGAGVVKVGLISGQGALGCINQHQPGNAR